MNVTKRHGWRPTSLFVLSTILFSTGCATQNNKTNTLADWDIPVDDSSIKTMIASYTPENVAKVTYEDFINNDAIDPKLRLTAINRLSKLQLEQYRILTDKAQADSVSLDADQKAALEKSLTLLKMAYNENPQAKDVDKIVYQIAQLYEKTGNISESISWLGILTRDFPQSVYVPEAYFRIGEEAFLNEDYFAAEVAYTEVSSLAPNHPLFEKAMIKRGWSRIKQGYHADAVSDFTQAINARDFGHHKLIQDADKNDFNEYFRALSIAVNRSDNFDILNTALNKDDHIFYTYWLASRISLQEKQYDKAVNLLDRFIESSNSDPAIADAKLQQLAIYRLANKKDQHKSLLATIYDQYGPQSEFYKNHQKHENINNLMESLRHHMLILAENQHDEFLKSRSIDFYAEADRWYKRYLDNFGSFANQDKVYRAYAELIASNKEYDRSVSLFEKAAFDGEIVLDKDAAYAAIDIAYKQLNSGVDEDRWFNKLLDYFEKTNSLYGHDERYKKVSLYLVEKAYEMERYDDVFAIHQKIVSTLSKTDLNRASYIQALAMIKLARSEEAEKILLPLVKDASTRDRSAYRNALGVAIYEQEKQNFDQGNYVNGIKHAVRLANLLPDLEVASSGLYDAIVAAIDNQLWPEAATVIELFQSRFPKHHHSQQVARQLSQVYMNLGNNEKAAFAFESLSSKDSDATVKRNALWNAAELYFSQKRYADAMRNYVSYANNNPTPYPQFIEAAQKIIDISLLNKDVRTANTWRNKIVNKDKQVSSDNKNSRTDTVVSQSAIALANDALIRFEAIHLVEPLAKNLAMKKQYMQEALSLYGFAANYGIENATLEATYKMGSIYRNFAVALLDSEKPNDLTAEELDEYIMLLEDQAFPFEEKAVELYEINLSRIAQNSQGEWIEKSLDQLAKLYPSRYGRKPKWTSVSWTEND